MTRRLLVALAATAGTLSLVPSVEARTQSPVWQCRASAAYASVNGENRVEPIVANGNINTAAGGNPDRAQCTSSETGAGNTPTQLGIAPDFLGAVTGSAVTRIDPELGRAIQQRIAADGRVEDLTLGLGEGAPALGVGAANATAGAFCVPGSTVPRFVGDSRVADITLGGVPIPLDDLLSELTDALNPLLGAIVEITVDERIQTADSLTIRALHVKVLNGVTPLVDLVVGEAKVGANGAVCDPSQQGDPSDPDLSGVCPAGSVLIVARNLCVITAGTNGSSLGEVVIGRPFQGPSGGTVIAIDVARKRYGRKSPCLSGTGAPKFAIVGTNKADRITGTNKADRILGRNGNDKISGGRGNDCIEGGNGGDNMSGSLGNDKIYGSKGKDHLNGGPGNDRLSGGSGNDSINAAYGRDRVFGGSGRDFINVATAGPPATVRCGSGSDVARINRNERRRTKDCERVAVFGENDR